MTRHTWITLGLVWIVLACAFVLGLAWAPPVSAQVPWYCAWYPPLCASVATPTPVPPTPTPAATSGPTLTGALPWFSIQTSDNRRMLDRVNALRRGNGLGAVQYNALLNRAAQRFAEYLAETGQFTHTPSDGSHLSMRVNATGYQWISLAENLEAGSADADAAYDALERSPAHLGTMLGDKYTEIGVGHAHIEPGTPFRDYWVQVFACPAGGSSNCY